MSPRRRPPTAHPSSSPSASPSASPKATATRRPRSAPAPRTVIVEGTVLSRSDGPDDAERDHDSHSERPGSQPFTPQGADALPISRALVRTAQGAREEARKNGRDRRYQITWVPCSLLVPADYNPRIMPDEDMTRLEESLDHYGMVEPIILNTFPGREGVIVGGHQRLMAAVRRGWPQVGVVWTYLSLGEERALNLALNRIHGQWDEAKLAAVIRDLAEESPEELPYTGFTEAEMDDLLATLGQQQADDLLADEHADDLPPPESVIRRTLRGDLWALGPHRLVVGDSTRPADVAQLLAAVGGERACCMWTDPPYGVSYVGKTKDALTIQNDGSFDLDALLRDAFACATDLALQPGAALYVCHPAGAQSVTFGVRFLAAGWRLHETLVWVKDSMVLGHSDYHIQHESILFGYRPDLPGSGRVGRGGRNWYSDDSQVSIFTIPRPKASRDHPTQKPLALIGRMLANSTPYGGLIYEPFLGSGSTLIAADTLDRRCMGLEIDPQYADVILARYEQATGNPPTLLSRVATTQPAA